MHNNETPQSEEQHQQISLLLPWYSIHSLDPAERQQVENHVRYCLLCRRELADLAKLATAVKHVSDCNLAAEASFKRLRAKMQTARQPAESFAKYPSSDKIKKRAAGKLHLIVNATSKGKSFGAFRRSRYKRLAIPASLLLAIIPFATQYQRSPTINDYHKLSVAGPKPGTVFQLRVAFSKSISDVDLDALLAKIHGKRVAGPSHDGAYSISLDSDQEPRDLASAIGFLRSQPDVTSVKPLLPP